MIRTCLTIMEPWATILLFGEKPVENRRWYTHHRGDLLIHAGVSRTWLKAAPEWAIEYMEQLGGPRLGMLLGAVEITGCISPEEAELRWPLPLHPYITGPECWVAERKRAFAEPVEMAGQRGLFKIDHDIILPELRDVVVKPIEARCDSPASSPSSTQPSPSARRRRASATTQMPVCPLPLWSFQASPMNPAPSLPVNIRDANRSASVP